jgi:oligopeptide transport system ATP-binding protein
MARAMSEKTVTIEESGSLSSPGVINRPDQLLTVDDLRKYFPVKKSVLRRRFGASFNLDRTKSNTQESELPESFLKKKGGAYVRAVDSVSFSIGRSEIFALVGESGCGKTTIAKMIIGLLKPTSGRILFEGKQINVNDKKALKQMRRHVQIIYQDPYSSLDPSMKVGTSIAEPLSSYGFPRRDRKAKVDQLLTDVGLRPEDANRKPREFSGGQRQRIAIARALALDPKLVIADEPVSALDISVRAQILNLLLDLKEKKHVSILIIAHDLSMVRHVADRVAVMHLGKIVELADNEGFFEKTLHPYSEALLEAVPIPDPALKIERVVIKGELPNPINPPSGCRFHTRCPRRFEPCDSLDPKLLEVEPDHYVACHLYTRGGYGVPVKEAAKVQL